MKSVSEHPLKDTLLRKTIKCSDYVIDFNPKLAKNQGYKEIERKFN